ncbi:MAG: cation:proton antiporter, partial [Nanoarchaeota archaeon]
MSAIIYDIGIVVIFSAIIGFFIKFLKQPLLLAYIIAGFVIGPHFLNYISDQQTITTISELGITFLLFIVGLDFNIKKIKEANKGVFITGIIQVIMVFLIGFFIASWFKFNIMESAYIGLILAFSSTLLIVTILSDKNELDTIHGRIIIGILVLQDIIAILALSVLSDIQTISIFGIISSLAGGLILILTAFLSGKFILKQLFDFAARFPELLFIFSIAVVFFFSFFAVSLGLSMPIGAFIAGIIIANMPYSFELIGKVKPLSNFFNALFFVGLGMQIAPKFNDILIPMAIMLGVALVIKPLIILVANLIIGYDAKTSFTTALNLGQISEFSLILASQGLFLGHISNNLFSLTIIVTVVSMTLSSYLLKYEKAIYYKLRTPLKFFEKNMKEHQNQTVNQLIKAEVVVNGYRNIDTELLKTFSEHKKSFVIVDNDPNIINNLRYNAVSCIYGDIGESEIFNKIAFDSVEIVISTIADFESNLFLIKKLRKGNKKVIIIVTANKVKESLGLYESGADYVIIPSLITEKYVAVLFEDFSKNLNSIITKKLSHLEELKKKQLELNK